MHRVGDRHESRSRAFAVPAVTGAANATNTPVVVAAGAVNATASTPAARATELVPTPLHANATHTAPHRWSVHTRPALSITAATHSASPSDGVPADGTASKSPSIHPSSASSSSLVPPPTPSKWMVRGPASGGGSPAAFGASLLNLAVGAHHHLPDSASSFGSSSATATLSPLLQPRSALNALQDLTNTPGLDAVLDQPELVMHQMERASGRKRTPRSSVLSGAGSIGSVAEVCWQAAADAEGTTTPSSTRLLFSRRPSACGSVYEGCEDLNARSGHRPSSCSFANDDEDGVDGTTAAEAQQTQSTLHSSRSRTSANATTTNTRGSTPLAGSLPAVTTHATTAMVAVMADIPASSSTNNNTSTASFADTAARCLLAKSHTSTESTPAAVPTATTAAKRFGGRSPPSPRPPARTFSTDSSCGSSPLTKPTSATAAAAAAAAGTAATREGTGFRFSGPSAAPSKTAAAAAPLPLNPPSATLAPHAQHLSSHGGGGFSGRSVSGGSNADLTNAAFMAVNHFSSTMELPTWPHYSKNSSYGSFDHLHNESEHEEDADGVGRLDGRNEEEGDAEEDEERRYEAALQYGAAASATTVPCSFAASSKPVTMYPASHSATVHPYDAADSPHRGSPMNRATGGTGFARTGAGGGFALIHPTASAHPLHGAPPAPLQNAWTTAGAADDLSAGPDPCGVQVSRSSSSDAAGSRRGSTTATPCPAAAAIASGPTHTPLFSNVENQPPCPPTAPPAASTVGHHPCASRPLFSRFGAASFASSSAGGAAASTAPTSPPSSEETNSSREHSSPPPPPMPQHGSHGTAAFAMTLPPPPPPPSRIPSPLARPLLPGFGGGFAGASSAQPPGQQLLPQRPMQTFSRFTTSAASSGHVSPCNMALGQHLPQQQTPLSPPPPPPPPPLASAAASHTFASATSFTSHHNGSTSAPHFGGAVEEAGMPVPAAVRPGRSRRSTPEVVVPGSAAVEATVDGMPVMVLPPAVLRQLQQENAGLIASAAAGTASGGSALPANHHHRHSHPQHQRHGEYRCPSVGSNGGGGGSALQHSPFSQPRPGGPAASLMLTTGVAQECMYTSDSSLFTSPAQTITSTASDPMLLSFSSGNLAAPMASNGSNHTNSSLFYAPNSNSATSGGSSVPPATNGSSGSINDGGFVMRADTETVQSMPRGKIPRMPGCSMRDWTAQLAAKEAERRREYQQQQQQPYQRNGSGSARGGETHQRTASTGPCGTGPGSCTSARAPSPFSSPASQHPPGSKAGLPRMTPQEIAKHNTPDDLWMVIRNVVYDCTEFQRFHPGGEKLLMACAGRDATEVYDRFHAWVSCESFMGPYAVGVLAPP